MAAAATAADTRLMEKLTQEKTESERMVKELLASFQRTLLDPLQQVPTQRCHTHHHARNHGHAC